MFQINYRIVDDIGDLKMATYDEFNKDFTDIFGFFCVNYNGISEGYYHENDLQEGELGQDMLVSWFDLFLTVLENFNDSSYVAFREIGTLNTWYEFFHKDTEVYISRAYGNIETAYIIFENPNNFNYPKWKDIKIPLEEFANEILSKSKEFVCSIASINEQLLETNLVKRLLLKIGRVETFYK